MAALPLHPMDDEKSKKPGEQVQHLSSSLLPTLGRQSQAPVSCARSTTNETLSTS